MKNHTPVSTLFVSAWRLNLRIKVDPSAKIILEKKKRCCLRTTCSHIYDVSSSSYMALQPISGLGFLFMAFLNLTLIDGS
jgi:hypothetical protein